MKRIYFTSKILLLLAFFVICTLMPCSAITKKQVVILDLPHLDFVKFSRQNYPNLWALVSAGSTGLVTVPASIFNGGIDSFGLHLAGKVYGKGHIKPAVFDITDPNRSKRSDLMIIDGDNYNNSRILGPELTLGNSCPSTGTISGIQSIIKHYRAARDRAKIIVIAPYIPRETENFKKYVDKEANEYYYQALMQDYEYLVASITPEINFNSTLLLVCSTPPSKGPKMDNIPLASVIVKGKDFTNGVLYSPSTRKKGIITFNDLRYTVFRFLHPETESMFPIKSITGNWHILAESQTALTRNYSVRWPLLTGYGYLLLGIIFLFLTGFILHGLRAFIKPLAWAYLYLLTVPAVFLLEALIDPVSWLSIASYTLGITGALFFLAYLFAGKDIQKALLWITFFTTGLIIIDGLFNGYYEYRSFLGYSVVTGARYYGIGNEYMGILLGSYIVGFSLILQKLGRWRREILWSAAFFIGLVLIHPYFGADVGGGITALMGLGITNYLWLKQPIRIKEIAQLIIITLFSLCLAGVWDFYADRNSMSHLGLLLLSMQNNGFEQLLTVAARKMALNIHLISTTPLTIFLIGILLAIPFLFRYPPVHLKRLIEKYTPMISGFTGLCITALIGLLANDSGIVSAAMIFMFGISMIMIVIIKEQENWKRSPSE